MPDPVPTLLPSLYDDAMNPLPTSGVTASLDISGAVLPDLVPKPDASRSVGNTESLSVVRDPAAPAAPAPAGEQVASEDLGPKDGGRRARSASERIAQLTRQRYEAQNEATELRAQIAELRGLLTRPPAQVQPMNYPSTPAPQVDPVTALLNSGAEPAKPAATPINSPALTSLEVSRIVDNALESREQRARQQFEAQARLKSAWDRSFAEVVQDFPALADQNSHARQVFNALFDSSPLKALPDAPMQIAMQVRGILADERARAQAPAVAARKQQAAVIPSTSPTDQPGANVAAVKSELDKAYAQMRSGDTSNELHARVRKLRWLAAQGTTPQQ